MTTSDTIQQAQQAGDLAAELAAISGADPIAAYSATVRRYLGSGAIAWAQAAGNAAHDAALPGGDEAAYDAYRAAFDAAMGTAK
jgi:hypothetical protein